MALAECYLPQLQAAVEAPYAAAMPAHRPLTYLKTAHINQLRRHHQRQTPQMQLPPQTPPSVTLPQTSWAPAVPEKDYSIPLHVDCSVEYELPDCAKPPQGVKIEPLLMIHPAHFRRLDSLRRCPFVNNLPAACALPAEVPAPVSHARRMPRQAEAAAADEASRRPRRWARPSCCGVAGGEPWPREGDTVEQSGFGKSGRGYGPARSARHASHPYSSDLPGSNCDKTLDLFQVQGNRLISPYRAKMFPGDPAHYQNYPIVMYK